MVRCIPVIGLHGACFRRTGTPRTTGSASRLGERQVHDTSRAFQLGTCHLGIWTPRPTSWFFVLDRQLYLETGIWVAWTSFVDPGCLADEQGRTTAQKRRILAAKLNSIPTITTNPGCTNPGFSMWRGAQVSWGGQMPGKICFNQALVIFHGKPQGGRAKEAQICLKGVTLLPLLGS